MAYRLAERRPGEMMAEQISYNEAGIAKNLAHRARSLLAHYSQNRPCRKGRLSLNIKWLRRMDALSADQSRRSGNVQASTVPMPVKAAIVRKAARNASPICA